jgi:DNA-binding transcriptional regulator YdaS (Cro superfamily)
MTQPTGIELAVAKFDGSPTKLARAVGGTVLRQHVEHWLKTGIVPADRAPDVELATGVPCEQLCPGTNWSVLRNKKPGKRQAAEQGAAEKVA